MIYLVILKLSIVTPYFTNIIENPIKPHPQPPAPKKVEDLLDFMNDDE